MSEPNGRQFGKYSFYKLDPLWRRLPWEERADSRREFSAVFEAAASTRFMRSFSLVGLRGDADFWNFREDDADYYKQPGDLFRLMKPEQQQALFDNTARAMGDAPEFIKRRHIDNCSKADPAYGAGVAKALGL